MSIRWRLLVAFGLVTLVAAVAIALVLNRFERQLRATLGEGAVSLARGLVETIDRDLSHRVELLQDLVATNPEIAALLTDSNLSFAALGGEAEIVAEMERRDRLWTALAPGAGVDLIDAVSDNPVSSRLRDYQELYRQRYGYLVYGEIFLTNRYGANVAETMRTSDYRQDDEAWWQAAQRSPYIGDVQYDESAGISAVEIGLPIVDPLLGLIGVAKAVLNVEQLHGITEAFTEGSGYDSISVHLYDASGRDMLLGAEEESTLQPPRDLLQRQEGFLYTDGGRGRLLAQARSRDLGWSVVVSLAAHEILRPLERLRRTALVIFPLALVAALLVALATAVRIARPIENAATLTERLAAGELDTALSVTASGEVGRLMQAVDTMLGNVREAVSSMIATSGRLTGLSSRLVDVGQHLATGAGEQSSATQETSAAVEQMATSIREVAESAQRVAGTLEGGSSSVEEMAAAIRSVASKSQQLSRDVEETMATVGEMVTSIEAVAQNAARAQEASQAAVSEAADGSGAVRMTIEGMARISAAMHDISEVIRRLDERSQRITQIIATIEEIAKKSHLLALNATVQAAHAGEHGRGFAAVAEEVGLLAERSATAVKEIGSTLEEVQGEVRLARTASQTGSQSVTEGVETASRAGEVLTDLATATEQLSRLMLEVRGATEEQVRATSAMATTFERMRSLTSEVESATREQAASSERISDSIEAMHSMAVEVSTATREQSRGAEQVAQTVLEIATVATTNADTAKNIVESSQELEEHSRELRQVSTFFTTGEGDID